jgi:hypothetical protein
MVRGEQRGDEGGEGGNGKVHREMGDETRGALGPVRKEPH